MRWEHDRLDSVLRPKDDDQAGPTVETIERNSIKCIRDGIRLGLDRIAYEPLPERVQELVRVLQAREHPTTPDRLSDARRG
jgi:hypothetical protein